MSEALEERIDRILREMLDSHLDLLALLLAESGVPQDEQILRLESLIQVLRNRVFEPTIFDSGRRVPTSLEDRDGKQVLVLNSELFGRVSNDEVTNTLARPIAALLGLSAFSVTLALQTRDELTIKGLTTKVVRKADHLPVKAADVPSYVDQKIAVFAQRLHILARVLGRPGSFEIQPSEDVRAALRGAAGWPEWSELSELQMSQVAVTGLRMACLERPWESHVALLAELLWDSLGLTAHSFFRHAGRALRGANVPQIDHVLEAMVDAVRQQETWLNTSLSDWGVFGDIYQSWKDLARTERRAFGVTTHDLPPRDVSVIQPAREAFGLDAPTTLPWDFPVVCWTVREQTALRDLFVGLARTLPIPEAEVYPVLADLELNELELNVHEDLVNLGVHMAPLSSELIASDVKSMERAASAVIQKLASQFEALSQADQESVNERLRLAYNEFFPGFSEIWDRHFYSLHKQPRKEQFVKLIQEVQTVLNVPIVLDPFLKPSQSEVAPFPTLTLIVAMTAETTQTPFYVPVSALNSTHSGVPIRVRAIRTPLESTAACVWLCDRTLALNKLQGQAVDLLTRAIHGDCMRFALFI